MNHPPQIEKLKRTCFICNKIHAYFGGLSVQKLFRKDIDKLKKSFIFIRTAPLGCWLAHNKRYIEEDFYKEDTWYGWKPKNKNKAK